MNQPELAAMRLSAQRISDERSNSVAETVRWMGALQAQDYPASLWAIGLRTAGAGRADIEAAIQRREIVRTWPMRGTLHFISPELVRPVLRLCGPRIKQRTAGRSRQLEIDDEVLRQAADIAEREILEFGPRTRPEMYAAFARAGIVPDGQRGIHILGHLSRDRVLCFGPHRAKQPTFVLLDEWLPAGHDVPDDEVLRELALRYFRSHGPATPNDFAWWSNLTLTAAREGLESCSSELEKTDYEGKTYWFDSSAVNARGASVRLLPAFDEYVLGYTDRALAGPAEHLQRVIPGGNGMFLAAIVDPSGALLGLWRQRAGAGLTVTPELFLGGLLDASQLEAASSEYAAFHGLPLNAS